jgi:hypothetical protein
MLLEIASTAAQRATARRSIIVRRAAFEHSTGRQACAPEHLVELTMAETSEDFLLAAARALVDSMVVEDSTEAGAMVAEATDSI